jgi:hypothetical protein
VRGGHSLSRNLQGAVNATRSSRLLAICFGSYLYFMAGSVMDASRNAIQASEWPAHFSLSGFQIGLDVRRAIAQVPETPRGGGGVVRPHILPNKRLPLRENQGCRGMGDRQEVSPPMITPLSPVEHLHAAK